MPDCADLENHHADRVGDDVVQLARDPRALLCHRDPRGRLTLALCLGRAYFGGFGLRRALAQGVAREPADPELERNEDELARRSPGDVVDHDHCTAENDRQADAATWRGSRTFPSRNAAAIPMTKKLCMNGSSCASTNEIPAASSQYAAGPAKG